MEMRDLIGFNLVFNFFFIWIEDIIKVAEGAFPNFEILTLNYGRNERPPDLNIFV